VNDQNAAPVVGTHVYTMSRGWLAFMLAFSGALVVGPLIGIGFLHADPAATFEQVAFVDLLLLGTIALGAFCAYACLRYRLVLTRDGIEQRQAFTTRRLRNHEIAQWRIVQSGSGPAIIVLLPRDGVAKRMQISRAMKTDQVFENWLSALPNADLLDEQRLQQQVQADPAYGSDPAQRLRTLSRLRTWCDRLGVLGTVIGLWALIYPHPYTLLMILLGVCPPLGLAIILGSGGRIHLDQKQGDKRPMVAFLMILPAVAIGFRGIADVSLLDWPTALAFSAVGGALFGLAAVAVDSEQRRWSAFLLTTAIIGVPWCYGVAVDLDVRLDPGAPQVYRTTVIDKHQSTGKGARLYLKIARWGPVTGSVDEVVDRALYDSAGAGDTVCVSLHEGAFGWRWYWLDRCPRD
jgi:hypothetical protein